MSAPVTITLPFPPSVNGLFAGRHRRHLSPRYRAWRRHAEAEILAARVRAIAGPVRIGIRLHAPDKRPRDASNSAKAIEDSLVRMLVIPDDHSGVVKGITSEWGERAASKHQAKAEVTITPVG